MPHVAARTASRDRDTGRYQSHRPEQTLLYQIVDEYYRGPLGIRKLSYVKIFKLNG